MQVFIQHKNMNPGGIETALASFLKLILFRGICFISSVIVLGSMKLISIPLIITCDPKLYYHPCLNE